MSPSLPNQLLNLINPNQFSSTHLVAGPLAGKLNSAQKNDASAWLPKNAESTQVVELA